MPRTLLAAAVGLLLGACQPSWPTGLDLPPPEQGPLPDEAPERFMHRGHVVQPVAGYTIEALVLSKMRYRFDRHADVSPVDLALGWGPMSQDRILNGIRVRQNDRWYFTQWSGPLPLDADELGRNAANTHLVYRSDDVEDAIDDVEAGQVIRLEGALVNVTGPGGEEMRSSLSRDDRGGGACEVMWVDFAEIIDD